MVRPRYADAAAEAREDYLMDLRGYRILPGVLTAHELAELTLGGEQRWEMAVLQLEQSPHASHFRAFPELYLRRLRWLASCSKL